MSFLQRSKLKFKPNINAATSAPSTSAPVTQTSSSQPTSSSDSTAPNAPTALTQPSAASSHVSVAQDVTFLRPSTPFRPGTPRIEVSTASQDAEVQSQKQLGQANDAIQQSEDSLTSNTKSNLDDATVSKSGNQQQTEEIFLVKLDTSASAYDEHAATTLPVQITQPDEINDIVQSTSANTVEAPVNFGDVIELKKESLARVYHQEPVPTSYVEPRFDVPRAPLVDGRASQVNLPSFELPLQAAAQPDHSIPSSVQNFGDQSRDETASNASVASKRRRTAKEKAEIVEPDYSSMRMADFVRYNPTHKPAMSWKRRGKGSSRNGSAANSAFTSPSKLEAAASAAGVTKIGPDPEDEQPGAMGMLRIGADGKLEINQEALTVVRRDPATDPTMPVINMDPTQRSGVYRFAKRRTYSQRWSAEETLLFYKALYLVGSDFSAMEQLGCFRNRRDRRMLKNKFKKEERENCTLIHDTISRRVRLDDSDRASFQQFLARLRLDLNTTMVLDDDSISDGSHADSNANASSVVAVEKNEKRGKGKRKRNGEPAETNTAAKRRTTKDKSGELQNSINCEVMSVRSNDNSEPEAVESDAESTATDASWRHIDKTDAENAATRELPARRSKLMAQRRFAEIAEDALKVPAEQVVKVIQATTAAPSPAIFCDQPPIIVQRLPGIETLRRPVRH